MKLSWCPNLLDYIIPPVCYSCYRRIDKQSECLCSDCFSKLKRNREQLQINQNLGKINFDQAICLFYYESVIRELIHDFKYKEILTAGRYMGNIAIEVLKTEYPGLINIDGVVAVPMHPTKLRERIYNQAHFLAKIIAKGLNKPDYTSTVKKTDNTQKQALMSFEDRLKNPHNTFKIQKKANLENKSLMIIDDVFTTGATANELAGVLKNSGVDRVYVFTIASGFSAKKVK